MAELNQKLYVKKDETIEEITCYTTLEEVQGQGIPLKIEGVDCYAAYGDASDTNASLLNYKKSDGTEYRVLKIAQIPYGSQGYYSPGTYSFTAPANILRISARAGGGGGGGGSPTYFAGEEWLKANGGVGGNGGSVYRHIVKVTKGTAYSVTIGNGGHGGYTLSADGDEHPGGNGGNGGNTCFSDLIGISGGGGGHGSIPPNDGTPGVNGLPMESNPALPNYGGGGWRGMGMEGQDGKAGGSGAMIIEWGGDIQ